MSGERVQRALALFREACELPAAQRPGFLAAACGGDDALRAEVESMLRWDDSTDAGDAEPGPIRAALSELARETETAAAALPATIGGYRIVRLVARGGMGDVYEAEQDSPRRRVAIKVARVSDLAAERARRFELEAQLLANLRHPRIAQIIEAGTTGPEAGAQPFFVMEFVAGQSLKEYAAAHALDARERLELVAAVCDAIGFAHQRGVIHRDLKPDNLLIEAGGKPKVLDFGVAKVEEAGGFGAATLRTEAGRVVGTLGYMAPEQLAGRTDGIGPEADVYSLGVVAYELLSGRLPHELDAVTLTRALAVVTTTDAPRLGTIRPEYRGDVEAVVAKALEKDPRDRYPDALRLKADIERFLRGAPIEARPAGPVLRLRRWTRRNPALATAVFGLFLALSAAAGILWMKNAEIRAVLAEYDQLEDAVVLEEAERSANVLPPAAGAMWPTRIEQVEALDDWYDRYSSLAGRLETLTRSLDDIRSRGRVDEQGSWTFGDDHGLKVRHDALAKLVRNLGEFTREGGLLARVDARRRLARTIAADTIGAYAKEWQAAIDRVRDSETYGDLRLLPMVGLIPLGPDPRTGLEEFLHLETHAGDLPRRDERSGRFEVAARTGLIFVLIPGGSFTMGAQSADEQAQSYDPQAAPSETAEGGPWEVSVSAFLLSKYEMTGGQWQRIDGTNPTSTPIGRAPDTEAVKREPVQTVPWQQCEQMMRRLGLALPTEAQWEYAARAGTTTPWPGLDCLQAEGKGSEGFERLRDFANVCGKECEDPFFVQIWDERHLDPHKGPAQVGLYAPNAWGLHDVIGNVCEWCADKHLPYDPSYTNGDRPRLDPDAPRVVFRGGCFFWPARFARAAMRGYEVPRRPMFQTGVRPAANVRRAR